MSTAYDPSIDYQWCVIGGVYPARLPAAVARFGAGFGGRAEATIRKSDAAERYSDAMPENERKLIQRIRQMSPEGASVVRGIGDDAAVLRIPPGEDLLLTTDFSIENVHFRRQWHPPETVGWRCLARGLSDIAAMGGEPRAAFLSLALAGDVPQKWVNGFLRGLLALAKQFQVPLAGGDTAQAQSGIQADIVVVGSVPKGKAVLRSGAKPGDGIYVTGELGGAALALSLLMQGKPARAGTWAKFRPMARVAVGRWLREHRIPSAMIDVSDGLSTDLAHICEESGVGAEIEEALIPRAEWERGRRVDFPFALHGGDEYELLFTSARKVPARVQGVPITRIGQIQKSPGMKLLDASRKSRRLQVRGWEHFAGAKSAAFAQE